MKKIFRWAMANPILPGFISLVGVGLYLILAWGHAHGQVSVIDEGLYLYKGYLFANGEYRPFQDYGPLTNHMPLSFLIPGYIQQIFGAGIWTGRLMAISVGLVMLLGLWLVTRRVAGSWWGVVAIWSVTLNSALVKLYSQAISQVLVACMLVWIVVLVVGRRYSRWQVLTGVFLSGVLFFTRINMAPVLPIVILYVFWQYGRKLGGLALIIGLIIVGIGHAIYWPGILKLWANWIPQAISPFLNSYRLPVDAVPFWDPSFPIARRTESLLLSLKMHFVPFIGFAGMLLMLIVRGRNSLTDQNSRSAWVLVTLFGVLFIAHAIASLGLNYCVSCLRNYLAFFSPLGLILLSLFGQELGKTKSHTRTLVILGILAIIPFTLGFTLGNTLTESVLDTDVTKVSAMAVQPGTTRLSVLLENKLGLASDQLEIAVKLIMYALFILVPLVTLYVHRIVERGSNRREWSFTRGLVPGLVAFLVLEMSLATNFFSNGYHDFDCGEDVIRANEAVGHYLNQKLTDGSTVYWGVGRSPVPLLYLPGRNIYPSQLNGDYTFMLSGGSDPLVRMGYWNGTLARTWLRQADYVLVEERVYPNIGELGFDETFYDEITRTPPADPCRKDSSIMIFKTIRELE